MAATISFYAGASGVNTLGSSGLGFYGDSGFGYSVDVNAWQGRTFVTNSAGTIQGSECTNIKYVNRTGWLYGQTGSGLTLNKLPNYLATLNIRFTNDTTVRVQNAKFISYDRVATGNPATGVTLAAYECVHPDTAQTGNGSGGPGLVTISGQHAWYLFYATGATPLSLQSSPGTSGLRPSGSGTTDTRHDWFLALSASPDSIGSKTFAGYVSLEYL